MKMGSIHEINNIVSGDLEFYSAPDAETTAAFDCAVIAFGQNIISEDVLQVEISKICK